MITIYRSTAGGLQKETSYDSGCWVNVVAPTQEELHDLAARFDIPLDFLTDPLDVYERARMEREEGTTLIVLRTCWKDQDSKEIPYKTLPIGVILTHEMVITVCLMEAEVIRDCIEGRVKGFSTDQTTRFVLLLFMRSALLFLAYLKDLNRETNKVEKHLHRALRNEELIQLMFYEKSLVFFTTSLRANALMLEKFHSQECLRMTPDERDLLEDLIVENRQAIEMANIYSNILSDMMDAFASVISNNLNVVMKLLTTVTLVLMIPNLVASFYGMNVELPFQHTPQAFLMVIGISLFTAAICIVVFWRKEFF